MKKESKKKFFIGGIGVASILGGIAAAIVGLHTMTDKAPAVNPQPQRPAVEITNAAPAVNPVAQRPIVGIADAAKPETFADFTKRNVPLFFLSGLPLVAAAALDVYRGKRYVKYLQSKPQISSKEYSIREAAWRNQRRDRYPDETDKDYEDRMILFKAWDELDEYLYGDSLEQEPQEDDDKYYEEALAILDEYLLKSRVYDDKIENELTGLKKDSAERIMAYQVNEHQY